MEIEVELVKVLEDLLNEKVLVIASDMVEEEQILKNVKFLSMGAEAIIARCVFLGIDAVVKWRFPKPYIPPKLDADFRRNRTVVETKALLKALALNINAPIPLYVEPDRGILVMTYIDGDVFRDIVEKISTERVCEICRTVGIYVAKLHENSIVHGDVTTSNIIVGKSGEIYMIDFGLANFVNRLEDQAIDVHILFRSIESAHFYVEDLAKKCFIEGYKEVRGDITDRVIKMVEHIRRMGRYIAERKIKGVWTS